MKIKTLSLILFFLSVCSFGLSAQCDVLGISGSDVAAGELLITWNGEPNATKYFIQVRERGTTTWLVNDNNFPAPATSYPVSGLVDGTEYELRMRAFCGGWGPLWSIFHVLNEDTSGGGGITCATATNLNAGNIFETSAQLSWDDMNADDYRLQVRPAAGGAFIINTIVTVTNYTATGLTAGTDYEFRVRSRCSGSWEPNTAFVPFTTTGSTGGTGSLWTDATDHIYYDGDVLIGAAGTALPAGYNLYVQDGILTEKVKVALSSTASWSDYVFANDYTLNTIEEVETFIKANKHLPHVPSAKEVKAKGIDVAVMDATLLRQIEELWLHIIEMKKENEQLKEQVKALSEKK